MNKTIAAATAALVSLSLAPAVQASQPTSAATAVSAAAGDYSIKKRNQFWSTVRSVEPSVSYVGKRSTVKLGMSICDYLRAGADMYDIVDMVISSNAGSAEDAVIAVVATAPVVLCPDQQYKFE